MSDVDPMAGLRGMAHADAKALIEECARQAGIKGDPGDDFSPLGWNLLFRVANAAHTAGAKAREAALTDPDPESIVTTTGAVLNPRAAWPFPPPREETK